MLPSPLLSLPLLHTAGWVPAFLASLLPSHFLPTGGQSFLQPLLTAKRRTEGGGEGGGGRGKVRGQGGILRGLLLLCRSPLGLPHIKVSITHISSFQGIVLPQIMTGIAANLVNALANYVFLYHLHLGVM